MLEVRKTDEFDKWVKALKDRRAIIKIASRIRLTEQGSLGDVKPVGEGVSEMRINYGPGYRIYFTKQGSVVVILLCGGSKKTQAKDIKKAKDMAKRI